MKPTLLFFLFLLPGLGFAQKDQGKIIYQETVKMTIDIPEEHREQLKGIMPESRTASKVLMFNKNESIYKDKAGEKKENVVEAGSEDSGMNFKMVMRRADNQLYKNLEKNHVYEKQEIFDKQFIISDGSENLKWKLTNENKEILGYPCAKALLDDGDSKVEAWFASEIPISNGPMKYGQLPGMILELNINEDQVQIIATEIQFIELDKEAIVAPSKGKKVNREEFEKIRAEKQKEMEEEYGGSGGNRVIIRTRGN